MGRAAPVVTVFITILLIIIDDFVIILLILLRDFYEYSDIIIYDLMTILIIIRVHDYPGNYN